MSLRFKGNLKPSDIIHKTISKPKKIRYSEQDEKNQYDKEYEEYNLQNKGKKENKIYKTPAEKSYELVKKKRIMERIENKLETSHKEKIEKFNRTLSNLSDHFDIPRVGPG